ncbi:MAG: ribbon-helix-helix domain-containing protein [Actinomycetota bacterium]
MSNSRTFSARLDSAVAGRLDERSAKTGQSRSRLVERYLDEGMRIDEHPGIVFRDGPAGRRAALGSGPDVWEVMSVIRASPEPGPAAIAHAAGWLNLTQGQVQIAVRYYAAFPAEVDARIASSEQLADEAEAVWNKEQSALG